MSNGQLFEPPRRWHVNEVLVVDGICFRVVEGDKDSPDELTQDLCLEHKDSTGKWRRTKIVLPLVMVDFLAENESALHPVVDGKRGGQKVLEACRFAMRQGWRSANDFLEREKTAKRREGSAA